MQREPEQSDNDQIISLDHNNQSQHNHKPIWKHKQHYLYQHISINHICNIQDAFFINQKSLKDPEHQEQSFLKTIFYFKSVAKVSVSQHYVTLHLKKRSQSFLPKQYFIERFKSFGNREFYEIAIHLQHISQHLKQIKSLTASEYIKQNFSREKQEKILEESLNRLNSKKFFSFFYEFTQQGSSLNQIIISKALLIALGYDYEDIIMDFLKYQQAIFEIISVRLYGLVMQKKSQLVDSIFQRMKQQILSPEEVKEISMFRFNDDLLSKSKNLDYEEKIRSRIKFSKTHPSVTIFEVERMNKKYHYYQNNEMKRRGDVGMQHHNQSVLEYKNRVKSQQQECVKNLLRLSENEELKNQRKICNYRLKKPELGEHKKFKHKGRRIIKSSSDSEYLGFDD